MQRMASHWLARNGIRYERTREIRFQATQEAFGLVSARVTYEPPAQSWRLSVFGTYLSDEKYLNSGMERVPRAFEGGRGPGSGACASKPTGSSEAAAISKKCPTTLHGQFLLFFRSSDIGRRPLFTSQ
jgi:hypothetical protein